MSNSSGSILQLPPKATALSNVNLLIVTGNTNHTSEIFASLQAADIEFTYELIDTIELTEDYPQTKYSTIIYDHAIKDHRHQRQLLQENLQWLSHLYPQTPVILITDVLGDEQAASLMQSGVDGYLLRQNLVKLPAILQQTWFAFVSKQAIATQQQDLIQQQAAKIEQLEQEKQTWLKQEQAKQEHISHLNHELRNPLASIIGFARMLKEKYYGDLNDKQLQYVSGILSSGEHLLALVNNYLAIVKIEAKKQTLDLEKVAVGEVCQAAMFILEATAKQKGLKLILDIKPKIDFCTADSVKLKQILINLLSNAVKFTDVGSVTLRVRLQKDLLHFTVIDTGVGISAKNIEKLFKPFPQITSHYESTGLGLALSRKLARLHGGDITVTSKLGKGSCFDCYIPQHSKLVRD